MARIRTIKPEIWTSEQFVGCSFEARLLFIGILNFCDDAGRHPLSIKRIKMEVFPADEVDSTSIRRMIDELSTNGLLLVYECSDTGCEYIQVTGWFKHQRIDRPSFQHPARDGQIPTTAEGAKQQLDQEIRTYGNHSSNVRRTFDEHSTSIRRPFALESKGKESNGEEENPTDSLSSGDDGEGAAAQSETEGVVLEQFIAAWNAAPGVRHCMTANKSRKTAFRARMREPAFRDRWRDALKKFPLKCCESDPDGWQPDIDWFLRPGKVVKVLEGAYDFIKIGNGKPPPKKPEPDPQPFIDTVRRNRQ